MNVHICFWYDRDEQIVVARSERSQ
jgi:hypothetical protein